MSEMEGGEQYRVFFATNIFRYTPMMNSTPGQANCLSVRSPMHQLRLVSLEKYVKVFDIRQCRFDPFRQ